MKERQITHYVILTKFGEDIYIDEATHNSSFLSEKERIENVAIISGNCSGEKLTLTQDNIVELRNILNVLIDKELERPL